VAWFEKKGMRICNNLSSIIMDYTINQVLTTYRIPFGITIQNIMAYQPYDFALSILAIKLGITNKVILSVILAFLL
jgi:hypothetical protein